MLHDLARITLWLFSWASLIGTNVNSTASIVDLGYAQYQGSYDAKTNITSFLSVRYAAPPTGKLRFQAPQPPIPESGVQPATQNPVMCYQSPYGTNISTAVSSYGHNERQSASPPLPESEDCLFLNVFIPGKMPTEPVTTGGLPVLIWIHGGGYQFGNAATYPGGNLVSNSLNNLVVVVIQYRLGVFGFLSSNEIKAEGALNAGLLDQTFALQWVQDHIGRFGGNRDHVTIWGESAGGGSVLQHIVANGGNTQPPLFRAAIASSTYLPPQYKYNDRLPQSVYDEAVAMTGCASSSDTFTCLQDADVDTLQATNINLSVSAFFGTFVFVPVVDGTLILERPTVALSKGQINGNEGDFFMNPNQALTISDYVSRLFPDMSSSQLEEAARVYENYGTALEQATTVMGDAIFVCPTYYLLKAFAGRSWKGYFAVPPADHLDDVLYYFQGPNRYPPYNNMQFVAAFSQSFMSLAKDYSVNANLDPENITPFWTMYDIGQTEMLFNRTEAGQPVVKPIETDQGILERCAFWSTVTDATAQ